MPRKDANAGPISAQAQQDLVSEGIENFELPKSIVTKIAKSSIPENAKLQKDTVLSLVKGSTVFINYLAATAHDVAVTKQHKSISASDVLKALEMIEFGDIVDTLSQELLVYRELAKADKSKKGSSNVNASSASAKKAGSTSASAAPTAKSKGKGKEKAGVNTLPPPFTSAPLQAARGGDSISAGPVEDAMDIDEDLTSEHFGDEEEGDVVEDDVEEDDEPEEDPEDPMAVEEEGLLRDAQGLDDMIARTLDDD